MWQGNMPRRTEVPVPPRLLSLAVLSHTLKVPTWRPLSIPKQILTGGFQGAYPATPGLPALFYLSCASNRHLDGRGQSTTCTEGMCFFQAANRAMVGPHNLLAVRCYHGGVGRINVG